MVKVAKLLPATCVCGQYLELSDHAQTMRATRGNTSHCTMRVQLFLRERTGQSCVSVHHTFITEQLSQLQNWAQGLKIKIHCTT